MSIVCKGSDSEENGAAPLCKLPVPVLAQSRGPPGPSCFGDRQKPGAGKETKVLGHLPTWIP